jgi:HAD superfamily hydrolase (TIGR01490 family)
VNAPDLAVFDLDGTLTKRDTFLPFLRSSVGLRRTATAYLQASPLLFAASRNRARRDEVKAAILQRTMGGVDADAIERDGVRYAEHLARTALRPDVVARLRWHQAEGHDCAIASASLTAYVRPLAARLGVDHVLATDLEVGPDGRLTGRLAGANCRGAAKARRIEEAFGTRPLGWAYGDSVDDSFMLERAEHPVLVGRAPLSARGA